jgi:hypothetical protein
MGTKIKFKFLIGIILSSLVLGASMGFALKKTEAVKVSVNRSETVWVGKPDGAQSCSPDSGISLAQGVKELENAHITVLESKKGSDGNVHIQMCGAPTGSLNLFLIPRESVRASQAIGFQEITNP